MAVNHWFHTLLDLRGAQRHKTAALRFNVKPPRRGLHVSRLALLLAVVLAALVPKSVEMALAQSPITAEVDRTAISTNEQLTLTVTVSGDLLTIPTPNLSNLEDFRVVGTSSSTQLSIINGELTSQGRYMYRLQPLREGMLVIPPISIEMDGQTYQTAPFEIEVVAGSVPVSPPGEGTEAPDSLGGQILVEAEVDNDQPYLGQQIIYTFRFYQATNLLRQPDYQPPSFTNFWGHNILTQPQYTTSIDGQNYVVSEIRTALFPASIGQITIDSAKLVIPGGLFEPDVILETKPISVDVRPLPEDAPADFSGAVGQFELTVSLSEVEGKVNEPVTLIVDITGTGNIETLAEPALPELPNWRVFESQSSTHLVDAQEDVVRGGRRFERLIVPGQPGRQTIPPISFSYFEPEAEEYRTISTDPIVITIQPGETEADPVTVIGSDKQPITLISGDIRHIKPVPTALRSVDASMLTSPLYWACWVPPLLVVGGVWVWHKRRQRFVGDAVYARRQTARRTARQTLAQAEQADVDSYALVQRALLGYLSDKLNQPTVGLTTGDLTSLLNKAGLEPVLIERVQTILSQADIGRFAPVEKGAAQSLVADTRQLIDDLEKAFRRLS